MDIRRELPYAGQTGTTRYAKSGHNGEEKDSPAGPSDSFHKLDAQAPQVLKNISAISKEILGGESGHKGWTFSAGSIVMTDMSLSSQGKLLCQDQKKVYSLNAETGEKVWELTKDLSNRSSLAIGPDGTAFLGGVREHTLLAVDSSTGKEKWSAAFEKGEIWLQVAEVVVSQKNNSLFLSGLTSDGGKKRKVVMCLDSQTGEVRWKKKITSDTMSEISLNADESSLVIDVTDKIISLDPSTGDSRWSYPTKKVSSTLGYKTGPGGHIYFSGADGKFHALDSASGKELWHYRLPKDMWGVPEIGPDGTLFFNSDHKILALDGEKGTVKWKFNDSSRSIQPVGISPGGTPYYFDGQGDRMMVLDGESGRLKEDYLCFGDWRSSRISSNGFLYYAEDNEVHALKLEANLEKLLEASQQEAAGEVPSSKIDQGDGFVVIDGIKLPVRDEKQKGNYFLIR